MWSKDAVVVSSRAGDSPFVRMVSMDLFASAGTGYRHSMMTGTAGRSFFKVSATAIHPSPACCNRLWPHHRMGLKKFYTTWAV
jgi:hypothetical protein